MLSGDWPPANNTVSTTAITVQRNNNKLRTQYNKKKKEGFPPNGLFLFSLYNTRKQDKKRGESFIFLDFSLRLIESELHKLLPDHYFFDLKKTFSFVVVCLVCVHLGRLMELEGLPPISVYARSIYGREIQLRISP